MVDCASLKLPFMCSTRLATTLMVVFTGTCVSLLLRPQRSVRPPCDPIEKGVLDPVEITEGAQIAPIPQGLLVEPPRRLLGDELLEGPVLRTFALGVLHHAPEHPPDEVAGVGLGQTGTSVRRQPAATASVSRTGGA